MDSISIAVETFIHAHLYLLAAIEIVILPLFVAAFYAVISKGSRNRLDRRYLDRVSNPCYIREGSNPNYNRADTCSNSSADCRIPRCFHSS